MTVSALGDAALVVTLAERIDPVVTSQVRALVQDLERNPPAGVVDVVGAFASVAVFHDPVRGPRFEELRSELTARVARVGSATEAPPARRVEVPVCYGGEFGPDLQALAEHVHLTAGEVVARHARADYVVHAVGFTPGFPYLGGLPAELAMPRRATPRPHVPAGSVGIGGAQTGIYPSSTPGGWNLIGRTPLALFDATRPEPALLAVGDRVTFQPIDPEEFPPDGPDRGGEAWSSAASPDRREPGLEVLRPGMLTTVQDLGRVGQRRIGVPLSGAADAFALRVANLLVGNEENAAGLEFTLAGPELRFLRDGVIALGGADFGAPRWRPLPVRAGETLRFGNARSGCRGYLALGGGLEVPRVLGSASTCLRARFGGVEGRALRAGDVLAWRPAERSFSARWRIDERILPHYAEPAEVRVVAGRHAAEFGAGAWDRPFTVSPQSDRMGVRLRGPALARTGGRELVSSPVSPGTIQVPPDGQPIVLLADAQTIGGYPQLGHVVSVDLPVVAQLRPGAAVRFRAVELAGAEALMAAREHALGLLREGLAQKLA